MIEIVATVLVVLLCLSAAAFDLKSRRVPNWLNLLGLTTGLVLSFSHGWKEGALRLAAVIVVLSAGSVLWSTGVVGGGDAKLIGAVTALNGIQFLGVALFWSLVIGGIVSALLLLARRQLVPFLAAVARMVGRLILYRILDTDEIANRESQKIPLAVIIAAGVTIAVVLDVASLVAL